MEYKQYLEMILKDLRKNLQEKQEKLKFIQNAYNEEKIEYNKLLKIMQLQQDPIQLELLMAKLQSINFLIKSYAENVEKVKNNHDSLADVEKNLLKTSSSFSQMFEFDKVKNFSDLIKQKQDLIDQLSRLKTKFDELDETFEKRTDSQEQQIKDFQQVSRSVKDFLSSYSDFSRLSSTLMKEKAILKDLEEELKNNEGREKSC